MGGLTHIPPLAIQPEQPTSPLDQYSKLLSVRQLQTHGQIQQQQLQANDLENQQRQVQLAQAQQDQKDQINFREAFQKANGDPDQTVKFAAQAGVGPKLLVPFQQSVLEHKTKLLGYSKEQQAFAQSQADLQLGAHNAVANAAAADKPAVYQQQLQGLQQLGIDTSKMPQQYPGDDVFKTIGAVVQGQKQLQDEAFKQAETSKNTAQAGEANVGTQLKQLELAAAQKGGAAPGIPLETQEANSWLSKNPGKTLADYQRYAKTLVPAFNFNLQAAGVGSGQGGGAAPTGAGGAPLAYADQIRQFGAKGGVVKAIIEGRQDPPASFAQKSPYWQDVMQKVYAVDPEFNQQRAQLRKDYTVGKHSTEINAINTAMGHVGVMGDAIDALNNNDVKVLNKIANAVGVQVGKDNVTTFNTIVHRVGPEISKAYIGSGGSAGERGSDEKDFDPALGPQQLKSNVGITAQLLRSKIGSLENQWDQNKAPSMPAFQGQFITKEATKQLNKWAPQGGGGQSGQTGGGTGKAVSLAAAKQLPVNKGKSDDEIRKDIEAHGHQVAQ